MRNTSIEPKASKMANNTIGYGLWRHAEGGKKRNRVGDSEDFSTFEQNSRSARGGRSLWPRQAAQGTWQEILQHQSTNAKHVSRIVQHMQIKKQRPRKGVVSKPIISEDMCSRAQVDLISFESEFAHILNYKNHLTQFVTLPAP